MLPPTSSSAPLAPWALLKRQSSAGGNFWQLVQPTAGIGVPAASAPLLAVITAPEERKSSVCALATLRFQAWGDSMASSLRVPSPRQRF